MTVRIFGLKRFADCSSSAAPGKLSVTDVGPTTSGVELFEPLPEFFLRATADDVIDHLHFGAGRFKGRSHIGNPQRRRRCLLEGVRWGNNGNSHQSPCLGNRTADPSCPGMFVPCNACRWQSKSSISFSGSAYQSAPWSLMVLCGSSSLMNSGRISADDHVGRDIPQDHSSAPPRYLFSPIGDSLADIALSPTRNVTLSDPHGIALSNGTGCGHKSHASPNRPQRRRSRTCSCLRLRFPCPR